jgi:hypothetical protein
MKKQVMRVSPEFVSVGSVSRQETVRARRQHLQLAPPEGWGAVKEM